MELKKKVSAKHITTINRIIKSIGIKEIAEKLKNPEVQQVLDNMNSKEITDADLSKLGATIGIDIAYVILEHLDDCLDEVFVLLADLTGTDKDTVGDIPIDEFAELIAAVCTANEFKQCFTLASKLLN